MVLVWISLVLRSSSGVEWSWSSFNLEDSDSLDFRISAECLIDCKTHRIHFPDHRVGNLLWWYCHSWLDQFDISFLQFQKYILFQQLVRVITCSTFIIENSNTFARHFPFVEIVQKRTHHWIGCLSILLKEELHNYAPKLWSEYMWVLHQTLRHAEFESSEMNEE
jgi:hypothetical protein